MNLSRRSLFVIIPVVFLSYCLAGILAYMPFESTLRNLEENRLNLAVTEMTASFRQYSTFGESYLMAMIENRAIRRLISEQDSIYRQVTLGASIEKSIRNLEQHQSNKLSLLVAEPNGDQINTLFFFELSDDPFAEISEVMLDAYRLTYINHDAHYWHFDEKNDDSLIVIGGLLDRTTFSKPVPGSTGNSVLVQLAIEPSEFLKLRNALLDHYQAEIQFGTTDKINPQTNLDPFALSAQGSLSFSNMISVVVPPAYLQEKLKRIKLIFAGISGVFFVISSLLLFGLVRKYITRPISRLEKELGDVIQGNKDDISLQHQRNDEIGRLEKTFQKLYSKLSESYLKTKELAEHDNLTKLHNLSYIYEKAQKALDLAGKNGESVAFIYIDLDNFKFVNDKYGHEIGDELLKAFALRLTRVIRSTDLVYQDRHIETTHGRIAGDEFSVIARYPTGLNIPERIANRILSIFHHGFNFEKGHFPVSASIGIAVFPEDGHTLTQLVSNADNAMYQAKHDGKNKAAFYSKDLAMALRRKMEIEQELKSLDPDHEFFLVYMPLVNALTRRTEGFEVLLRWHSEKLGFVGPDEFVPIAESCGLFNKIDAWVAENAIAGYHKMKERLGYDFKLSINLSSAQLNMNLISKLLHSFVIEYNVPSHFIQLEITETLNVEYTQKTDDLLNTLCQQGFQIAIDDFGTGFTALLQLIEFPAQMIKFDKVFVEKTMRQGNRQMLEPLVSLCHSQGLKVTIEGVETEEMAEYLTSIGCDYLQGYLFGKPARFEELQFHEPWQLNKEGTLQHPLI